MAGREGMVVQIHSQKKISIKKYIRFLGQLLKK